MEPQEQNQNQPVPPPVSGGLQSALPSINQELKEEQVKQEAEKRGMEYANLAVTPLNPDCIALLKRSDMLSARCLVISRIGKRLRLALSDPDGSLKDGIVHHLESRGYVIRLVLVSVESFASASKAVERYGLPDEVSEKSRDSTEVYEEELERFKQLGETISGMGASEMLRTIVQEAYATGASDIHIDPQEDGIRLRFRIDGLVQDVLRLTPQAYRQFLGQLKYESHMKLNVTHVPQDGRLSLPMGEESVDVRVATLPTLSGETVSMRVLDARKKLFSLSELGFIDPVLSALQDALKTPQGLLLVVGPTGSGKTTSLYTFIKDLQRPENRIVTLEDPIEYHLSGIAQSQVDLDQGYDFVTGLKALVRQDPDIIMVGEVREAETARIAFQAALTGHMVLTSLHAGGAVESVARLLNIGLQPFMIAPALQVVLAQRLVRKLCERCRVSSKLTAAEKETFASLSSHHAAFSEIPETLFHPSPKGCPACSHTGYRGRTAIAEVLKADESLRSLIAAGASSQELLLALSRDHPEFLPMREYGLLRVIQGVTSLEEIERVAGSDPVEAK